MLTYWILLPVQLLLLLLHAADINGQEGESRSLNVDQALQQHTRREDGYLDESDQMIRRFECPAGFFRLRRNCYYLSGGTASWRDAYFQCKARNATLAVLNRYGKEKTLRNYLMGEQFRRLERWIGGIYNWQQKSWVWGVSSDKVLFMNFGDLESYKNLDMPCIVLDPMMQYKWNARSCIESKYFICEVPAGRIGKSRRRKNISDPLAPQNQRLRPTKKDEYNRHQDELIKRKRKHKLKSMRKKNWHQHDDNQIWAHGIKPGSRPPKGPARLRLKHPRPSIRGKGPRHNRKHNLRPEPRISQVTPGPGEYGAFPADGRIKTDEQNLQNLNDEVPIPRYFGNDFAREEILLKI